MYKSFTGVTAPDPGGRRLRTRRGYTLLEVLLAVTLSTLVMLAGMALYGAGVSLAVKSDAQVASAESAAVAVQYVGQAAREAYTFALPDDSSGFTPPPSYTASQFETTVNGTTVDTGIELSYGNALSVSVLDSTGATRSLTTQPVDQTASNQLWIYRANSGGTPNPSAGQYLWLYGSEGGASVNHALCRLFETASAASAVANAVVMSRPLDNGTPQAVIPYMVQIQIVSGYYSLTGGTQTSVNGSTQYAAECVSLRSQE